MNGLRCLRRILAAFDQRHLRRDGAVGPDLHDQLVVVRPLADAGLLDLVLDADDRREAGIDRDDADLAFLAGVLVGGAVAAAVLDGHLDDERHVVGQGGDDVLGVDDLDRLVVLMMSAAVTTPFSWRSMRMVLRLVAECS